MEDIRPFLFWTTAALTGGCAIAVLVSQNIVRSATWLLFTLGGTSGLFFLLGADFVGATQLLVYVGGTLVLVIFGVMLTAQGPFITMKTSAAEWAISGLVGLMLFGVLVVATQTASRRGFNPTREVRDYAPKQVLAADVAKEAEKRAKKTEPGLTEDQLRAVRQHAITAQSQYTDVIGLSFLGIGVGPAHTERDSQGRERVARTHYFLPFMIVSVHLLVVLIGAAYLARAKRRRRAAA